jgi:hypothetical protein
MTRRPRRKKLKQRGTFRRRGVNEFAIGSGQSNFVPDRNFKISGVLCGKAEVESRVRSVCYAFSPVRMALSTSWRQKGVTTTLSPEAKRSEISMAFSEASSGKQPAPPKRQERTGSWSALVKQLPDTHATKRELMAFPETRQTPDSGGHLFVWHSLRSVSGHALAQSIESLSESIIRITRQTAPDCIGQNTFLFRGERNRHTGPNLRCRATHRTLTKPVAYHEKRRADHGEPRLVTMPGC